MNKTNKFLICLVLLLATFLRFYKLDSLPISLFGDEIDIGYQAWSLITTGKDYTGHSFPLYFKSLTEWRMPGLVYLTAPIVGLLGPTTLSVRILPAFFGVLNILLLYILVRSLYPDKKIKIGKISLDLGIVSAFFLSISPWHIQYSRAGFDVTLQLFLILVSVILLVSSRKNILKTCMALFLAALSFYVYPTSTIIVPILLISIYLLFRPITINKPKNYLLLIATAIIVFTPYLFSLVSGMAGDRISGINIFNDQSSIDSIIINRTQPWVKSPLTEKIFHNKLVLYPEKFFSNYLGSFSTEFLFVKGDPNFRQSVGGYGELPLFLSPFFLIGLAFALVKIKEKQNALILLWLFISPIPAALTVDGSMHATRLFMMLLPMIIMSGLGIVETYSLFKKNLSKIIFLLSIVLLSLVFVAGYWHRYSVHYLYESAKNWHYGFESVFTQLAKIDTSSKRLFINNTYEPSLVKYAFFAKITPIIFQESFSGDAPKENIIPGFSGFKFGKNTFFGQLNSDTNLSKLLSPGDIYVAAQLKEIPGNWDWSKQPQVGYTVLGSTHDIYGIPLFTIIRKD